MAAGGTISANQVFSTTAGMAAVTVRAGPIHLSDSCGIADEATGHQALRRGDERASCGALARCTDKESVILESVLTLAMKYDFLSKLILHSSMKSPAHVGGGA
jgi:hypothetical protein